MTADNYVNGHLNFRNNDTCILFILFYLCGKLYCKLNLNQQKNKIDDFLYIIIVKTFEIGGGQLDVDVWGNIGLKLYL